MEEMTFGIVADTLNSEVECKIQQCYIRLNSSRDDKRRQLGECMIGLKEDCCMLENGLREMEKLENKIRDAIEDASQKQKKLLKRR